MKKIIIGLLILNTLSAFADEITCKQARIGLVTDPQEVCATIIQVRNNRAILELKTNITAYDIVTESGVRSDHMNEICELFGFKGVKSSGFEVLAGVRTVAKAGFIGGGIVVSKERQVLAIDKMSCAL